ncbi:DMT family transporter [Aestuariivita sp.]|jgi:drug/metabolite transporter (DMT)-like permease|uniref:DMT family transporter n=1 Tax=Aestuariivita sp. TaxID=1872407 RepID=UPI002173F581|nr:DMT family transporter [Aestuariivita sp.]MCE8009297.1 DMT family transporter [Aestuariivita sp.]
MERKAHVDAAGAVMLIGFAALMAFNQVVIKVSGGGFGPIFMAGLRSLGAIAVMLIWMRLRGIALTTPKSAHLGGVIVGVLFAVEFMAIYTALDITTVARASIMLYSMPVWLAIAGHFLLPGEALTGKRVVGLSIAMAGVTLALLDRGGGSASLKGDLLGVFAAMCWAGIALTVRLTPLSQVRPEIQLFWQIAISAPILLLVAPVTGDLFREVEAIHLWGLAFQILCIASFGFLFWFWLLARYPASGVASFSFLSPVLAVFMGWALLGERVALSTWFALGLVTLGLVLINRK